jgi:hypothetical protein
LRSCRPVVPGALGTKLCRGVRNSLVWSPAVRDEGSQAARHRASSCSFLDWTVRWRPARQSHCCRQETAQKHYCIGSTPPGKCGVESFPTPLGQASEASNRTKIPLQSLSNQSTIPHVPFTSQPTGLIEAHVKPKADLSASAVCTSSPRFSGAAPRTGTAG